MTEQHNKALRHEELPQSIRDLVFTPEGFVQTDAGLLVPAYIASQKGFADWDAKPLQAFYNQLIATGVMPLCPFQACGEKYDANVLNPELTTKQVRKFWDAFNQHIGKVNYEQLMPRSKVLIAQLDGATVDDGVAAEIGYFAVKHGPIIGLRTDKRLSENPTAVINPAVRYFIDIGPYGGKLYHGPGAESRLFGELPELIEQVKRHSAQGLAERLRFS